MKEQVKEYLSKVDKALEEMAGSISVLDVMGIDKDEFRAYQILLGLLEDSKKLLIAEAITMDAQTEKLNLILGKLDKMEWEKEKEKQNMKKTVKES